MPASNKRQGNPRPSSWQHSSPRKGRLFSKGGCSSAAAFAVSSMRRSLSSMSRLVSCFCPCADDGFALAALPVPFAEAVCPCPGKGVGGFDGSMTLPAGAPALVSGIADCGVALVPCAPASCPSRLSGCQSAGHSCMISPRNSLSSTGSMVMVAGFSSSAPMRSSRFVASPTKSRKARGFSTVSTLGL